MAHQRFGDWLEKRFPLNAVIRGTLDEDIPGGPSPFYSFGSLVLFLFIVQAATGVFQLFYYAPTVDHAYDSVSYLRTMVPFGWFIHSLHYWGAQLMVAFVVVHLAQVFIWGAFKNPRELTWVLGVFQFLCVLGMSFTGAALPWDVTGYWATEVGTSIAGTVPLIGDFIKQVVRGAESMGQLTLGRFFIVHIAILPGILAFSVLLHLVTFRRSHSAGPWNPKKKAWTGPFWPDQLVLDAVMSLTVLVVLVALTVWAAAPTTGPADATDLSVQPKPEWNFLFLYQAIKAFKGPLEPVGTVLLPLAAVVFLFLVPWFSKKAERDPLKRPLGMAVFIAGLGAVIALTIAGALSNPGQGGPPARGGAAPSQAATVAGGAPSGGTSQAAAAGEKLFEDQGCTGCHKINGKGGNVGPDLSSEGSRGRSPDWLAAQIRDPKSHNPKSVMPAYGSRLKPAQIQSLASYLSGLGGPSLEKKPTGEEKSAPPSGKPAGTEKAAPPAADGEKLFEAEGCTGCHKIGGKGGGVGPDLSAEGTRGRSPDWLAAQIRDPKSHDPKSVMPAYGSRLKPEQIQSLASYLSGLKSASPEKKEAPAPPPGKETPPQKKEMPGMPAEKSQPGTAAQERAKPPEKKEAAAPEENKMPGPAAGTIGNAGHGAIIFAQTCEACHGAQGTDKVPNPGSADGTVPPLNPIDREFFDADPQAFAEKIDIIIRHGSVPEGPHPSLSMPAWGDTHQLTEQAIANVEAYILSLNGVDRAKIMRPGMPPVLFFGVTAVCLIMTAIVLLIAGSPWRYKPPSGKNKEE